MNLQMKKDLKLKLLIFVPPFLLVAIGFVIWGLCTISWSHEKELCSQINQALSSKLSFNDRAQLKKVSCYKNVSLINYKKHLREFPLLQKEALKLKELESSSLLPVPATLKQRGTWIASGDNKISFEESWDGKLGGVSESIEKLIQPVQINTEDLFYLLSIIEGKQLDPAMAPPHLIVTDLQLSRQRATEGWEYFQLDKLEMIKRDYSCFIHY